MPNKQNWDQENWVPCTEPEVGFIVRWDEPIWASSKKPRGKPDKIGEQRVTARVTKCKDFLELEIMDFEKLTPRAAKINIEIGDVVRRKPTSLVLGNCHRLVK